MLSLLLLLSQAAEAAAAAERVLPAIAIHDVSGTEARALDDFLGQALPVDFFAHWCAPCAKQIPHLNQIAADYAARGLNVIAVTGDDPQTAQEWLDGLKARFPRARDPELRLQIELGFRPLPFAILVDPTGVIVWEGNPAELAPTALDAITAGSLALPAHRWPKDAEPLRDALRSARYAEARAIAIRTAGPGTEYAAFVDRVAARRADLMQAAFERGDYLTAGELAAQLAVGLPDGDDRARAVALCAQLAADERAQALAAVQVELRELWSGVAGLASRAQADELAAKITALVADRPGAYVQRRAQAHLATLASFKSLLR